MNVQTDPRRVKKAAPLVFPAAAEQPIGALASALAEIDLFAALAELAAAANWDRVFQRKAIPLAFLRHTV